MNEVKWIAKFLPDGLPQQGDVFRMTLAAMNY